MFVFGAGLVITDLPPIDRGQARLARPYPGGLFGKAVAARIQMQDPETAASYLTALGTHGQPGLFMSESHQSYQGAATSRKQRLSGTGA